MRDALGVFDVLLYRIFDFEIRVPPLLRSPYRGAVFILGMLLGIRGKILLLATIAALVFQVGPLHGILLLLVLTIVAMAAGGIAGGVYGLLPHLVRAGDFGVWLRWVISIYAYLAALTVLIPQGPFTLEDPAFHRVAALFSMVGALGIVLTDDRGAARLSPRNFRLLQNRILLRAAPRRMWYVTRRKRARYEVRRKTLEKEAVRRPDAWRTLRVLLTNLRTDLVYVRGGLERFRLSHPDASTDELADVDAWIERVNRQIEAVPPSST